RTPARRGDGAVGGVGARHRCYRVAGEERRQVGFDADGAHARAAAPVGNAERLVEVQVGDIAAEGARLGDAHQGVEVGAVDVHLAAVPVHQGADGGDVLLEHPVGGGVGDHQRGEPVAVLLG